MEFNASGLVKHTLALISLKGLTGEEKDLEEVRSNGRAAREPPAAPAAFASTLEVGVASGTVYEVHELSLAMWGSWRPSTARPSPRRWRRSSCLSTAACSVLLGWDDAQVRTARCARRSGRRTQAAG